MADGLLSSALGFIDRQKQAAKAGIGLLASNPQEWLIQTTARYLPTRAEEQQYRAVQQAGGDITQTPYYQKLFDLAQFQSSLKPLSKTQFQAANEVAQKNAVEMLGLPPDNTAMDRAKAMGFDIDKPVYHGAYLDIAAFDPKYANTGRKTGVPEGTAAVVSSSPKIANSYAFDRTYLDFVPDYPEGANVLPLLINKGDNLSVSGKGKYWNEIENKKYPEATTTNEIAEIAKNLGMDSATIKNVIDSARLKVSKARADTTFMFDPSRIRSRFAAFDPARANESDLLAAGIPIGLLGSTQVELPKKQEKKPTKK